jgi:hypothetical protein
MAEHHIQIIPVGVAPGERDAVRRFRDANAERLGRGGQLRMSMDDRGVDASFALAVAAKARLPIGLVRRHVCRHDEGVGDCSSAPMTVG